MDIDKLTCTENNRTLDASVLKKSDKFLEVVVEGANSRITLSKKTRNDWLYIGKMAGLEFVSTR